VPTTLNSLLDSTRLGLYSGIFPSLRRRIH